MCMRSDPEHPKLAGRIFLGGVARRDGGLPVGSVLSPTVGATVGGVLNKLTTPVTVNTVDSRCFEKQYDSFPARQQVSTASLVCCEARSYISFDLRSASHSSMICPKGEPLHAYAHAHIRPHLSVPPIKPLHKLSHAQNTHPCTHDPFSCRH